MATYRVQVRVEFDFEVDCDNDTEATEQGWNWEDYKHTGEVYSIDVDDITESEEEDE